jgi:hypothetical protein
LDVFCSFSVVYFNDVLIPITLAHLRVSDERLPGVMNQRSAFFCRSAIMHGPDLGSSGRPLLQTHSIYRPSHGGVDQSIVDSRQPTTTKYTLSRTYREMDSASGLTAREGPKINGSAAGMSMFLKAIG